MHMQVIFRNLTALAGLSICVVPLALSAPAVESNRNVAIPFANQGGIRDWQPDGTKGLWVQRIGGEWYYAKFFAPCVELPFAMGLHFVPEPTGALSRWSSIKVPRGGHCYFSDFQRSDGPPIKVKPSKAKPATDIAQTQANAAASTPAMGNQ